MTERTIVVMKTKGMLAREIADELGADEWEVLVLKRLSTTTLGKLRRVVGHRQSAVIRPTAKDSTNQ